MLTGPVAAARAVVATRAWVKSKHDMYLIRGSIFTDPPGLKIILLLRNKIKNVRTITIESRVHSSSIAVLQVFVYTYT